MKFPNEWSKRTSIEKHKGVYQVLDNEPTEDFTAFPSNEYNFMRSYNGLKSG